MIVLDTNVISELMRPEPAPAVIAWVAAQPRASLYTTSINRAEILYGIAALPVGRRREGLEAVVQAIFSEEFAGRILPFDGRAAEHYARIAMTRRTAGWYRRGDCRRARSWCVAAPVGRAGHQGRAPLQLGVLRTRRPGDEED